MFNNNFISDMVSRYKYDFTTIDLVKDYNLSIEAARKAIQRLKKRGKIVSPLRSFHVIIPLERYHTRSVSVFDYLDGLMKHLDRSYYIALMSAADLHGSLHKTPEFLQVITNRQVRNIEFDDNPSMTSIHFIVKKDMENTSVMGKPSDRYMNNVSIPEETLFDLIRYPKDSGGFKNIAQIAEKMSEKFDDKDLFDAALNQNVSHLQKAGFILDRVGKHNMAEVILPIVRKKAVSWVPMIRGNSTRGMERDKKWKLIINTKRKSDSDFRRKQF